MIKTTIYLKSDHNSKYEEIEITKEELLQLACNKAKEMYEEGAWHTIEADGELEIKTNLS